MRRTFAQTLIDLAEATQPAPEIAEWIRVTELSVDLPIEMAMHRVEVKGKGDGEGELEFLADVPRWRWRTPFDETPSRLRITWVECPPEAIAL